MTYEEVGKLSLADLLSHKDKDIRLMAEVLVNALLVLEERKEKPMDKAREK